MALAITDLNKEQSLWLDGYAYSNEYDVTRVCSWIYRARQKVSPKNFANFSITTEIYGIKFYALVIIQLSVNLESFTRISTEMTKLRSCF